MHVSRVAPDGPVPGLMHRRRVVGKTITYVGLDVHAKTISGACRGGPAALRHALVGGYETVREMVVEGLRKAGLPE